MVSSGISPFVWGLVFGVRPVLLYHRRGWHFATARTRSGWTKSTALGIDATLKQSWLTNHLPTGATQIFCVNVVFFVRCVPVQARGDEPFQQKILVCGKSQFFSGFFSRGLFTRKILAGWLDRRECCFRVFWHGRRESAAQAPSED